MMKKKRGQFFLVAAIIIVLILSGIATVKVYSMAKPEPRKIQDIGAELSEETHRVSDYGIYTGDEGIEEFFIKEYQSYFEKKAKDAELVFVYGKGEDNTLTMMNYTEQIAGTIFPCPGCPPIDIPAQKYSSSNLDIIKEFDESGEEIKKVKVPLLGKKYEFELKGEEIFYFLIIHETEEGETYVETNE